MSVSKLENKPRHPHCKFNIQLYMPNVLRLLLQSTREQIQKDSYVPSGTSAFLAVHGHAELGFMRPLELHCCNPLGSGPQARSSVGVNQAALLQPKVLLPFILGEVVLHFLMAGSPSVHHLQEHLTHKASAQSKSPWKRTRSYVQTWLTIGATLTMSWVPRWCKETKAPLEGI